MSELGDFMATTGLSQLFDGLGDPATHWPRGNQADAEAITVLVDRSDQGSEFTPLDTGKRRGQQLAIRVGVAKSVDVTCDERPTAASVLVIDGVRWYCERLLGEQSSASGLRYYLAVRVLQVETRQSSGR